REDGAGSDGLAGRGEVEVMLLHQLTDALQTTKRTMALVHVANRRRLAQGAERADPADAEDDLLADAHVVVAAVEPASDLPVVGAILGNVGIEQVERDAADLDAPDASLHLAAGERHADQQR